MKFSKNFFILVIGITIGVVLSKSNLKVNSMSSNTKKEKINIIGESYTTDMSRPTIAISEANAVVPFTGEELEGFYKPKTVEHLAEVVPIPPKGPLETIIENPTINEYYDGSIKLNVVKVKCTIYTTKSDCIQSSVCGWCGSSNSCVLGTNFGPSQPCVKSSWIYGKPYPNWEPQLRKINESVGGVSATIVQSIQ
jgi:hypothetical protein